MVRWQLAHLLPTPSSDGIFSPLLLQIQDKRQLTHPQAVQLQFLLTSFPIQARSCISPFASSRHSNPRGGTDQQRRHGSVSSGTTSLNAPRRPATPVAPADRRLAMTLVSSGEASHNPIPSSRHRVISCTASPMRRGSPWSDREPGRAPPPSLSCCRRHGSGAARTAGANRPTRRGRQSAVGRGAGGGCGAGRPAPGHRRVPRGRPVQVVARQLLPAQLRRRDLGR
ncbi:hypothetical protein GQ55_1G300000 [Panicum hallii var. hallii]|uniref:Uncharacterized protein n=1 Tax=Panicum hallii var. hallii TaxID=1504633 RepID=A0A2T7F900_9POAL|nr:hypothetical protein GQ55_1G300000 [Panicum hallii var. hallii]